jgi:serine/threonine-protein kinase
MAGISTPNRIICGRYELVHPAAVGGMGTVWRGIAHGEAGFQRSVAIKRMLPFAGGDDPAAAMFVEEARVVSELSHPSIVQVLDFCVDDEERYVIVMEWVEGLDLARLVGAFRDQSPPPWPEMTTVAMAVLDALHAAHERRDHTGSRAPVFHRDVTPTNVLVAESGAVKLTDFGLARAMDRAQVTPPGILKGKLAYMAPEYVGGGEATAATDQYSLGAVLWEALACRRLRKEKDPVELFARVARPIPDITQVRSDLPPALVAAVERSLSLSPTDRYPSCRAMARALEAVLRAEDVYADRQAIGRVARDARKRIGLPSGVPLPTPPDGSSRPTPTPA